MSKQKIHILNQPVPINKPKQRYIPISHTSRFRKEQYIRSGDISNNPEWHTNNKLNHQINEVIIGRVVGLQQSVQGKEK